MVVLIIDVTCDYTINAKFDSCHVTLIVMAMNFLERAELVPEQASRPVPTEKLLVEHSTILSLVLLRVFQLSSHMLLLLHRFI